MKHVYLPLGKSDFETIREKGLLYVDKTLFIEELLVKHAEADVSLINLVRGVSERLLCCRLFPVSSIFQRTAENFSRV